MAYDLEQGYNGPPVSPGDSKQNQVAGVTPCWEVVGLRGGPQCLSSNSQQPATSSLVHPEQEQCVRSRG